MPVSVVTTPPAAIAAGDLKVGRLLAVSIATLDDRALDLDERDDHRAGPVHLFLFLIGSC